VTNHAIAAAIATTTTNRAQDAKTTGSAGCDS
jgi:hypothetical protein